MAPLGPAPCRYRRYSGPSLPLLAHSHQTTTGSHVIEREVHRPRDGAFRAEQGNQHGPAALQD